MAKVVCYMIPCSCLVMMHCLRLLTWQIAENYRVYINETGA